jgi:POLQ-like helicase
LSEFGELLGFAVDEYASSKGRIPPRARRKRRTLFVATIEKGNGLVNSLIGINRMESIGLVIVDELHMLGEEGRGAVLETCLAKIRFSSPPTHIIGMSATLGNLSHLASFLDAAVFTDSFRPVDLVEYCKLEGTLYRVNYRLGAVDMCPVRVVPQNDTLKDVDTDQLLPLVLEVIPEEACLVFCASKRNCQNVAVLLATHLPRSHKEYKREEKGVLIKNLKLEASGLCPILAKTLPFGVAYHHSGLSTDERRLLEEAYLSRVITVITCTSTLAAGVNLPAKRVIIRSPYVGSQFLSKNQYKQMAGRAGRAGLSSAGESILIVPPSNRKKVMAMLTSGVGHCSSCLLGNNKRVLSSLILEGVALKLVQNEGQLLELMSQTLLHVQVPANEIHREVTQCLEVLVSRGYVKSKPNKSDSENLLDVTPLGMACFKGTLNIDVALHVYSCAVEAQRCLVLSSELHLLYLATPPDLVHNIQPNWMVYLDRFAKLSPEEQKVSELIGVKESVLSRNATGTGKKLSSEMVVVYHKFFLSLMLKCLLQLESSRGVWAVAEEFQCSRGFLQTLLQSSSSFASCLVHFTKELPELWAVHLLLPTLVKRLAFASSIDLVPLLEIPGMKYGRATQLFSAGYKTPQDIVQSTAKELVSAIDNLFPNAARKIIKNAKSLLAEQLEDLEEEIEKLRIISPLIGPSVS